MHPMRDARSAGHRPVQRGGRAPDRPALGAVGGRRSARNPPRSQKRR